MKLFFKIKTIICALFIIGITTSLMAQEAAPKNANTLDEKTIKEANNPLAPKIVVNVHNYVVSSIYGARDNKMNQLLLRFAMPVGPIIFRATMPFIVESTSNDSPETATGDFNMFAIYKFPAPEGINIGIGPVFVAPTASEDMGGQGKWQLGASFLTFFSTSNVIQFGTLLQWQMSIAGDDDRDDINQLTPQLFFMWQLGGGTYLRSTGVWTFNLENGNYNIPIGIGIGKVVKAGSAVFNIFVEPQFSVLAEGAGQPRLQTFFGFNTQF